MQVIYKQSDEAIDYQTGSAAVSAGQLLLLGANFAGVATTAIAPHTLGTLRVRGQYEVTCAVVDEFDAYGVAVYWDAGANVATQDDAGGINNRIGVSAGLSGETPEGLKVLVLLNA